MPPVVTVSTMSPAWVLCLIAVSRDGCRICVTSWSTTTLDTRFALTCDRDPGPCITSSTVSKSRSTPSLALPSPPSG